MLGLHPPKKFVDPLDNATKFSTYVDRGTTDPVKHAQTGSEDTCWCEHIFVNKIVGSDRDLYFRNDGINFNIYFLYWPFPYLFYRSLVKFRKFDINLKRRQIKTELQKYNKATVKSKDKLYELLMTKVCEYMILLVRENLA